MRCFLEDSDLAQSVCITDSRPMREGRCGVREKLIIVFRTIRRFSNRDYHIGVDSLMVEFELPMLEVRVVRLSVDISNHSWF